jgi:hypothetical protein
VTAYLVFNELSLTPAAANQRAAKERLDRLAAVLTDGRIPGKKVLVTSRSFFQDEVFPGYPIGRWQAGYGKDDRDRRRRLLILFDQRMDYAGCSELSGADGDVDFRYCGSTCHGFSAALLADGLSVSLLSEERWNVATVRIEKAWIEGEDVYTREAEAPHACHADHVALNGEWLARIKTLEPTSGRELWEQRAEIFPSLEFCDCVQHQLEVLGGDGPLCRGVLRGLKDLQRYCEDWMDGGFDIHGILNASGESQSTLQQYSEERRFRCPDGERRVFNWHAKRGVSRVHFFDFPDKRRLLVGYVGTHLRTTKF